MELGKGPQLIKNILSNRVAVNTNRHSEYADSRQSIVRSIFVVIVHMLTIYSRPILLPCNSYLQCLTVNAMPPGPLANRIRQVRSLPLSEFRRYDPCPRNCVYLIEGRGCRQWLGPADLPELLGWMLEQGYSTQPQLTAILSSQLPDVVGSFEYRGKYYRSLEQDGYPEEKNETFEKRESNASSSSRRPKHYREGS